MRELGRALVGWIDRSIDTLGPGVPLHFLVRDQLLLGAVQHIALAEDEVFEVAQVLLHMPALELHGSCASLCMN